MELDTTLEPTLEAIEAIAREIGFECTGRVATGDLHVRPEVRDMCAANKCHRYGHSWSCPPACDSIEAYQEQIGKRRMGIVVQTIGQMEDSFDFETIAESGELHGKRFREFIEKVRSADLACTDGLPPYPLGAGSCTMCNPCTYPDAPCRFPDKMTVSLEAAGFVVTEVCVEAGIPYNHGQNTISFTGGVFV